MSHGRMVREPHPGFTRRWFLEGVGGAILLGRLPRRIVAQAPAPAGTSSASLLTPAAQKGIAAGLTFLANRQNDDGSFGTGDYSRNAAVCGLCGMAFLAEGSTPQRGRYAVVAQRCLEFILSCSAESGLIHGGPASGREPMYGHGFATLYLAEVYGTSSHQVRDPLTRAVQLIVQSQNAEGGWRYEPRRHEADVSVTVCQVMALRAARNAGIFVPSETIDRAVSYLHRAQNPDGGFMYMVSHGGDSGFPRSAAAVVALMSAGQYDSPEVRKGIEYLQQHGLPPRSLAGHSYLLYGQYYAAQALWHVGGETWSNWYPLVREFLVAHQEKNGSWFEAISPEYSTAMACLILQLPNNYLPIFQR